MSAETVKQHKSALRRVETRHSHSRSSTADWGRRSRYL